ncbi:MAG TPA: ABC transporter permease subunit [Candidatus Eisenbacteria bacterium]|nr:ABC transporter permease subunit [Candidatus Eisenbacteria bacterium]
MTGAAGGILTIARLTLHEALRRRILLAALIAGLGFLTLFGLGLAAVARDLGNEVKTTLLEKRMAFGILSLAGLYAANLLVVLTAVLLPVDTLSGEIGSGVMQTMAVRPIRRRDIVIGKWLGHWTVLAAYIALVAGGTLIVTSLITRYTPPGIEIGIPLMLLEATILLTLSIAGGARLGTITNGMLAFGLYGLAYIGNWVEQIGTYIGNNTAQQIGTVASLLMPSESIWQMALFHMQPALIRDLGDSPFSPVSVASPAMIWWACGHIVLVLALGVRAFGRRAL